MRTMSRKHPPHRYTLQTIGEVHSCFGEKFGVPRQPGLADAAQGVVELYPEFATADAVRGLEQFSHLWLIFIFHQTQSQGWKPLVRPPRLGGNQSIGVFASRSTFRPNPIGMSVVRLERVEVEQGRVRIHICGLDLVNGTPVLDIKPYVRYSDQVVDAISGYADEAPPTMAVEFSAQALQQLQQWSKNYPRLEQLIRQVLMQDPRPAYREGDADREYGMLLHEFNLRWRVVDNHCQVIAIEPAE